MTVVRQDSAWNQCDKREARGQGGMARLLTDSGKWGGHSRKESGEHLMQVLEIGL